MITKTNIQAILTVLTTAILLWILPWVLKLATNEASTYPFTYYSCIINQFVQNKFEGQELKYVDLDGNEYNRDEYDSITPMFNYRQLLQDGRLPDSILGVEISPKLLSRNSFYFRSSPRNYNSKGINLYPMYESMSGRIRLASPDDMFTVGNSIRFYEAESNQIKPEKSKKFQLAMEKKGFEFPVKWIAGNPSARKAYDEGWFMLDSNGQLFHVKMVNGKPFVKNTKAGEELNVVWMQTIETSNRRFYGFIFDSQQNVYFLSDTSYELVKLPIEAFDPATDKMLIMANLFFWNVVVTRDQQRNYTVLNSKTMEPVDGYTEFRDLSRWEKIQPWVFPFYIEIKSSQSTFVYPRFLGWSVKALLLNFLFAIGFLVFFRQNRITVKVLKFIFILATGFCGFLALQLFNNPKLETKDIIQLK
nr:DUF4857 domain-containing protein [uncultured Draconibacterium sp.]